MLLGRYRAQISAHLKQCALPAASLSGKMVAYHMGWADSSGAPTQAKSGKLIRPTLCLWACTASGGSIEAALGAAAAIEWFHNFTLVHDDIQDEDRTRHGRDTVWSLWGVPQAINAGDAMQTLAFASLAGAAAEPQRSLAAVRSIAAAGLRVIEGQCLDLELEGETETTLRAYLHMVAAKTGALLAAGMEAGALLGGAAEEQARAFARAGRLLGTAFQVRDDWLGMFGDSALTGKSSSGDAGRYKMTFPVVCAAHAMSTLQRRRLREIFRARHENPEPKLRALLEEVGSEPRTNAAALAYAQKAVQMVARCRVPKDALEEFEEVAHYVATRSR